ncbi:NfeD family protein [Clostridium sp. UBA6640]|uniref:NfeD family protein n=1 Tax=Clostridium sp. UBA6640 TaxID=1946370 RepID=UPI0025C1B944|nr:NfeD family protein [Clostridium sp. UBA6640]
MEINWIWLLLTAFVIVIDFLTSDFVYSWLIIGFIPAFLLGFFVVFPAQVFIAVMAGGISIVLGLKYSRKYIKKNIKQEKLMMGKYLGQEFVANIDIIKEEQMKVNGVYWRVKNISSPIISGESFIVVDIENNKLIIKKGDE